MGQQGDLINKKMAKLPPETQILCDLLRTSLRGETPEQLCGQIADTEVSPAECLEKVCEQANAHAVLPMIYDGLTAQGSLSDAMQQKLTVKSVQVVNQSYRLLFLSKYVVGLLEEAGIETVVIKGSATAEYYPVPELRKAGDVDLVFFSWESVERAVEVLVQHGFMEKERQPAQHHIVVENAEHIDVELHGMLAEPFDNEKVNKILAELLQECKSHVIRQECMGVELPVLAGAYHGLELLLHCLQHFLRAGFGLKLLCDWVVFWQSTPVSEQESFVKLCKRLQVQGFVSAITGVCVNYLGLDRERVQQLLQMGEKEVQSDAYIQEFFMEIIRAEEFGKSSGDRMVAMRGSGFADYVREFHHQMRLNYPAPGRIFILWPALWVMTLVRFLHNNRRLRHISTRDILKNAKNRGRIVEHMNIFTSK